VLETGSTRGRKSNFLKTLLRGANQWPSVWNGELFLGGGIVDERGDGEIAKKRAERNSPLVPGDNILQKEEST